MANNPGHNYKLHLIYLNLFITHGFTFSLLAHEYILDPVGSLHGFLASFKSHSPASGTHIPLFSLISSSDRPKRFLPKPKELHLKVAISAKNRN